MRVQCLHQKWVAGLCEALRTAGWECKCIGHMEGDDCNHKLPYQPGGQKYWYIKKSDTKFKTWYMRALLICSSQNKEVIHQQSEKYYRSCAMGFPTSALGRLKFKFRGDVNQEGGDAPELKISRAGSKREHGGEPKPKRARGASKKPKKEPIPPAADDDDDDDDENDNDSDSDSSDSSRSSSDQEGSDSLPSPSPLSTSDDDPPDKPGSDAMKKAGTSAEQERGGGGPGEPPVPPPPRPHPQPRALQRRPRALGVDYPERDTSRPDDTIRYKKFRWTGIGPRSDRLGWEVTCLRKSHQSIGLNGQTLYCTRSLRFSVGGGE